MDETATNDFADASGDVLLLVFGALASPHRLRILAALAQRRNYVSQLAREVGISRPLLRVHLARLEEAGLVKGRLELSEDGKAMRYFEMAPFALHITPERITEAVRTLTAKSVTTDDQRGEA